MPPIAHQPETPAADVCVLCGTAGCAGNPLSRDTGVVRHRFHCSHFNLAYRARRTDDESFGVSYLYCAVHRALHSPGWCNEPLECKKPLAAETYSEAIAEARALGLAIHGLCAVCHQDTSAEDLLYCDTHNPDIEDPQR